MWVSNVGVQCWRIKTSDAVAWPDGNYRRRQLVWHSNCFPTVSNCLSAGGPLNGRTIFQLFFDCLAQLSLSNRHFYSKTHTSHSKTSREGCSLFHQSVLQWIWENNPVIKTANFYSGFRFFFGRACHVRSRARNDCQSVALGRPSKSLGKYRRAKEHRKMFTAVFGQQTLPCKIVYNVSGPCVSLSLSLSVFYFQFFFFLLTLLFSATWPTRGCNFVCDESARIMNWYNFLDIPFLVRFTLKIHFGVTVFLSFAGSFHRIRLVLRCRIVRPDPLVDPG